MPGLLAPIVQGPITQLSTAVTVSGLVPGAKVTLYADGAPLTPTFVTASATALVPIAKPLKPGQTITASQADPPAPPSTTPSKQGPGVKVFTAPPLATPAFVSAVSTCVDSVWIDGVTPGATVKVQQGSTSGSAVAQQSPCWVNLPGTGAFTPGVQLEAFQLAAGYKQSSSAPSYKLKSAVGAPSGDQGQLGKPTIAEPLLACQTSLKFEHMVASLDVQVVNGTTTEEGTAPEQSFPAGVAPLQPGTLTAHQFSNRCALTGAAQSYKVTLAPPPAPTLSAPICPQLGWISLGHLVPGAVLSFTLVWTGTGGAKETQPWGYAGVSLQQWPYSSQSFYLGALPATGPKGETSLSIQVEQILCPYSGTGTNHQRTSGAATFPIAPGGSKSPPPDPPANLYPCARAILVTGAHPGSQLQVFSPAQALSDPVIADGSAVVIKLWLPLAPGDQVFVQQTGCNADGRSHPNSSMNKLPSPLPVPEVVGPVLVGATSITVNKVVPGARVTLFVNDAPRSSIDSVEAQVTLPAGWPSLAKGDVLTAGQALCKEIGIGSPGQGGGVTVQAPVSTPVKGPGVPGGPLGSNNNYIMFSPTGSGGCENLLDVSVTLDVVKEIVWKKSSGGAGSPIRGFSFQLNCYSPKNPNNIGWQQFVVALLGPNPELMNTTNEYTCGVDLWAPSGGSMPTWSSAPPFPAWITSLPSLTIGKGYQITISLKTDPMSGNVTQVTFGVIDNLGKPLQTPFSQPIPAANQAPVIAIELNLVGPLRGQTAELSSGAGIFTYSAKSALTVSNQEPACAASIAFPNFSFTDEEANTSYGVLPANPGSNPFTQSFTVG